MKEIEQREELKLSKQLCFPIYALAKDLAAAYRPLLEEIGLTYPQYLVLLVLWEQGEQRVSPLGEQLELDSGTLTPLLKRLAQKGLVLRERCTQDERNVWIKLTAEGQALREKAIGIPAKLVSKLSLTTAELLSLQTIIEKIRRDIHKN